MKEKLKNILFKIKEQYRLHKKRTIGVLIVVAIILFSLFGKEKTPPETELLSFGDIKQTVLATGQVTSKTDLALSLPTSGILSTIKKDVGALVKKGDIIAMLDNRKVYADLQSARADYQEVLDGASNEEIIVAETAYQSALNDLAQAKNVQDALVASALSALLNNDLEAYPEQENIEGDLPTISGSYLGTTMGEYRVKIEPPTSSQDTFSYRGLEEGEGDLNTVTPETLGTKGLYIIFPDDYSTNKDRFTVLIPNTRSSSYQTYLNAYEEAKKNRDSIISAKEAVVKEKEASLTLTKASARPFEILSAEAKLSSAQALYDDTILRAPADGTIVSVDKKIGELVETLEPVVVLQDISNLYIEADINETNISKLALGQDVAIVLDAFPDQTYHASISHIDPSATIVDGIVNYTVKATITDIPEIKPGMTANITILISEKKNVLSIPKRSIISVGGVSYVDRIINPKRSKTERVQITTGETGDGDMVEVVSGLLAGDMILSIPDIEK